MKWHTEQRRVSDLIPTPHNPRELTEKQYKDLERSMKKFDLAEIPAINTDNQILAGHMRLKIMVALGRSEETIDVRVPDRLLTKEECDEYIIRSNKNTGQWDMDKLANAFNVSELKDWGFTEFDLGGVFDEEDPKDAEPQIDKAEELNKIWKVKKGDLWQLGEHRIICGDCTDKAVVERVMGGEKAELLWTDPPYGVSYSDKNLFLNSIAKGNCIQEPVENDSHSPDEMHELWTKFLEIARDYALDKCSSYYIASPQGGDLMMMMMMMMSINRANFHLKHMLIWVKNNHVLGRCDYNYKHEPILFGWRRDGTHKFYGKGEFNTSVWEIDKPLKNDLHPTMKPIELIVGAVLNSCAEGAVVFDPFLGSGSTAIACENTHRKCRAIEISPEYCAVAIQRWIDLTGKEPKLIN